MEFERYEAGDFLSEDVPDGYETVWGWLARHEPDALCSMPDPGADALCFQEEAEELAGLENVLTARIPAPRVIVETGGPDTVTAFPRLLLRAVFGWRRR